MTERRLLNEAAAAAVHFISQRVRLRHASRRFGWKVSAPPLPQEHRTEHRPFFIRDPKLRIVRRVA